MTYKFRKSRTKDNKRLKLMTGNILDEIRVRLPDMSKGQRRISDYILEHYDKAAYMTASRLGERAGASESTVVRYACELGFDGYPEMQRALREYADAALTSVQRIEVTDERIGKSDVLSKTLMSDIARIKSTLEVNDEDNFNSFIDSIIEAGRVYVAGARATSLLSDVLAYNLGLVFENVTHIDTTSESKIFEQMLKIGKGDVFIAMTFPRYSTRIIKAVQFAKDCGAKVICITDGENSPIAPYSDVMLFAKSDMASYMDSLVAPLSLIDAIIIAISRKKKNEVSKIFERLEEVWDKYEIYEKNTGG